MAGDNTRAAYAPAGTVVRTGLAFLSTGHAVLPVYRGRLPTTYYVCMVQVVHGTGNHTCAYGT